MASPVVWHHAPPSADVNHPSALGDMTRPTDETLLQIFRNLDLDWVVPPHRDHHPPLWDALCAHAKAVTAAQIPHQSNMAPVSMLAFDPSTGRGDAPRAMAVEEIPNSDFSAIGTWTDFGPGASPVDPHDAWAGSSAQISSSPTEATSAGGHWPTIIEDSSSWYGAPSPNGAIAPPAWDQQSPEATSWLGTPAGESVSAGSPARGSGQAGTAWEADGAAETAQSWETQGQAVWPESPIVPDTSMQPSWPAPSASPGVEAGWGDAQPVGTPDAWQLGAGYATMDTTTTDNFGMQGDGGWSDSVVGKTKKSKKKSRSSSSEAPVATVGWEAVPAAGGASAFGWEAATETGATITTSASASCAERDGGAAMSASSTWKDAGWPQGNANPDQQFGNNAAFAHWDTNMQLRPVPETEEEQEDDLQDASHGRGISKASARAAAALAEARGAALAKGRSLGETFSLKAGQARQKMSQKAQEAQQRMQGAQQNLQASYSGYSNSDPLTSSMNETSGPSHAARDSSRTGSSTNNGGVRASGASAVDTLAEKANQRTEQAQQKIAQKAANNAASSFTGGMVRTVPSGATNAALEYGKKNPKDAMNFMKLAAKMA